MADVLTRAHRWVCGNDTGISSKVIWRVMMGVERGAAWYESPPLDPDDFGRCHRLLRLIPEWRARIGEMKAAPGWKRMVGVWDTLEVLYNADRLDELYALMRDVRGVM